LDKKEIAELLESLCERPFTGGPPPVNAAAGRITQALSNRDAEPPEAPNRGQLAAILSGTASEAQCGAFREAAVSSGAARLEAQSALAFVDAIEQAPLAAPAHLVEQAVAFTGATRARPGFWSGLRSSLADNFIGRPGGRVVAACAVMLMAGGVAWSLLGPADVGPREVQPVSAVGPPPAGGPAMAPAAAPARVEPAPAEPTPAEPTPAEPAPVEPTPVVPTPEVPRSAAPAAAAVQALTDPCPPRLAAKSEAQASSDVRFRVTKPEPKQPPKTADLATPDPGCSADPASRLVVNPADGAGANPHADRGAARASRPAAAAGRSDHVPAAASAPAARPASSAVRPSAVQPSR
jgi:hypothetical protein